MTSSRVIELPLGSLPGGQDLSLQHLQLSLARLDVRLRREVRRWQLAGQDPDDSFRGLYVSDEQAASLLDRPPWTSWGYGVELPAAETDAYSQALEAAAHAVERLVAAARQAGAELRLERLAQSFDLDDFEQEAFLICLAPMLDLRYEKLYGYLQDDVTRKRPAVSLILDLLCEPGPMRLLHLRRFSDQAPLLAHRLLERSTEPGAPASPLAQAFSVDAAVLAWLLGEYRPDPELPAGLSQPAAEPAAELLAAAAGEPLPLEDDPLLAFSGPESAGQDAAARLFAARLGRPLLALDLAALAGGSLSPVEAVRLALRDARLAGAVLYLRGWDLSLEDGMPQAKLLEQVCAHPGAVILAGAGLWLPSGFDRSRRLYRIDFPLPDAARRRRLWEHFLAIQPPALQPKTGTQIDILPLVAQYQLSAAQIRDAAAAAADRAAQSGRSIQPEDLAAAARQVSSPRLSGQARKITPRFGWDDIVLPPDRLEILHELAGAVRGRPQVLEAWGARRKLVSSTGITALFAGPPGTGKTMAAEVIAAELRLDLYKIDLSGVVSKYIGETEKNLEAIFTEASSGSAILFFDEADALFGKRSEVRDAHDRYANVEISYLLQRMEAYDGVTILATNLRANLDEAFTRRLQFAVDFPFPSEPDRLRIWQALFPPETPRHPAVDFAPLAARYKLSGGSIRNAILSAAYLAAADGGVVTMQHLEHGTRREMQKMGKILVS